MINRLYMCAVSCQERTPIAGPWNFDNLVLDIWAWWYPLYCVFMVCSLRNSLADFRGGVLLYKRKIVCSSTGTRGTRVPSALIIGMVYL